MALTFSLGPNPKWYFADLVGRPLGSGYFATFSSLNHSILNPVFQDATGLFPWPYVTIPNVGSLGVLIDENGTQGPFYFQFNSAVPDQLYFIEVYDSNGVLQWTIDNYSPQSGGGGTIITTVVNIDNMVANSPMLRNSIGYTPIATSTFMKVAPGAHSGLAQTASNAGPDIVFLKNNLTATDTISFAAFAQGETFPNGEPTPIDYLHYSCTSAGSAETQKCVQFPITHGVQNIQNQAVTLSIFARCTAGTASTLTLNWVQFFGDGPSASVPAVKITPIQTLTLTSAWQKFVITPPGASVPSTTGKILGECGNDGLFLQVQYPLTATTTIDFTLLSAFMGSIVPGINFIPNDAYEAVMYNPRTGYIIQGLTTDVIGGYIAMNDLTIGSAASGATGRANIDTFPLYNLIYNNVIDTWAPVSGGRSGNAVTDFVANKTIFLPRALGRVLGTYGLGSGLTQTRVMGEYLGVENAVLPAHTHTGTVGITGTQGASSGGVSFLQGGNTSPQTLNWNFTTDSSGVSPIDGNMQPSGFMATFIKL
jgi:hypothetical protein